MKSVIVSDTTSLIVLEKLATLGLLCKLFEQVLIPAVVLAELQAGSPNITALLARLPCFTIVDVPASKRLTALLLLLDAGEANAIELATSMSLPLIIDERKGRQIAKQFGIRITGFAGLLIQANRSKLVDTHTALAMMDQAVAHGLRLAPSLQQQVQDVLEQTNG
jgi:predicted nucleic acid-binding protein